MGISVRHAAPAARPSFATVRSLTGGLDEQRAVGEATADDGAFTVKMLGLRRDGLPGWALSVVGGTVFALLVGLW